jgi:hypothetical protein
VKGIKTFQQMYRDGHLNRREILGAMGASGLTSTAAGALMTSASVMAATPKKGGRLFVMQDRYFRVVGQRKRAVGP